MSCIQMHASGRKRPGIGLALLQEPRRPHSHGPLTRPRPRLRADGCLHQRRPPDIDDHDGRDEQGAVQTVPERLPRRRSQCTPRRHLEDIQKVMIKRHY